MKVWKKLLVPTDFSPCASAALDLAVELVAEGGVVVLHHATDRPPGLASDVALHVGGHALGAEAWARGELGARLERLAAPARRRGVEVQVDVGFGAPTKAILAAVERVGADLVVIGTHGRAGLAHYLLGSVAEQVVRAAPVPVLTVRGACGLTVGLDDDGVEHQLDAEMQG